VVTSDDPSNPYADAAYALMVFDAVKAKFALEIVGILAAQGPLRFTDIQFAVARATGEPAHPKTINNTLTLLRANGLIEHLTTEPRLYAVKPEGSILVSKLDELGLWAKTNLTLGQ
jgi:DNA-binding HxlR family transcriptional regulator